VEELAQWHKHGSHDPCWGACSTFVCRWHKVGSWQLVGSSVENKMRTKMKMKMEMEMEMEMALLKTWKYRRSIISSMR
jgi:hypothetical protein